MKIFGIRIYDQNSGKLKREIEKFLSTDNKISIIKANSEFFSRTARDRTFREVLKLADIIIPDGIGVLWAARFLTLKTTNIPVLRGLQIIWQAKYSLLSLIFYPKFCRYPIPERIPGVEALYLMLEAAIQTNSPVFFLGASEGVNKKAIEKIREKYPELKIAGGRGGFWKSDAEIIDGINKSGAKLLIVALGSPKQEYWIRDNYKDLTTVRVAVGEGGSLDFIAGSFRRAPKWMQRIGLEWFWRLFMNRSKSSTGSRAKRVWNAVPVFIYEVIKYKIRNGATDLEKN